LGSISHEKRVSEFQELPLSTDKEVEMTLRQDPELFEPIGRGDFYDLQHEIADLNARLDALVKAVRLLARDQYKPVPDNSLNETLSRAEQHRSFLR
jgi:hypothetical protein